MEKKCFFFKNIDTFIEERNGFFTVHNPKFGALFCMNCTDTDELA